MGGILLPILHVLPLQMLLTLNLVTSGISFHDINNVLNESANSERKALRKYRIIFHRNSHIERQRYWIDLPLTTTLLPKHTHKAIITELEIYGRKRRSWGIIKIREMDLVYESEKKFQFFLFFLCIKKKILRKI